jgi:outer membrane biosynthesis protein TonB
MGSPKYCINRLPGAGLGLRLWKCETRASGRIPKKKFSIVLSVASVVGLASGVNAQSDVGSSTKAAAALETDSSYLVVHQEADPRFITSIERTGSCTLPEPPLETSQLRVPYQLYPRESAERHEEGTVKTQFIFDPNWCIRKATIVESTKSWRLDSVSLRWAMTIKWAPKKALLTSDGEPTVTFPIAWGASQRNR